MVANKVCLIVIDGWGISSETEGNAIHHAQTPVMDALSAGEGATQLQASGLHVGLPAGLMGNSEVGHLNIGAGRVVYQDIVRINMTIKNQALLENDNFVAACEHAKTKGNGRIHLLGLGSDGGVHSHIDHGLAMVELCQKLGVKDCFMHFFGDGRDTKPTSGVGYIQQVLSRFNETGYGRLASVTGRYYAMDRDKRHERIQIAYEGLVQGKGEKKDKESVCQYIESLYNLEGDARQTDEFLKPIIVDEEGCIRDGDSMVFFNYRSDRMRQIVTAFGVEREFQTDVVPKDLLITCMTKYKEDFTFPLLFPPNTNKNVLAEVLATHKVKQYHCAETEKYAHVTFFFNGGQEKQFDLETRGLEPSPRVATYDLQPEMNAAGVARNMCETIATEEYPFVMCNFAPPDMVGHTGKYEPTVIACSATDKAIGEIQAACKKHGYTLMVTADHGNAEQMISPTGGPHTAHTCMKVPFYVTGRKFKQPVSDDAALCDVATTVLQEMGIPTPPEMTGQQLLDL